MESEALWLDATSCQNARRPKQPSVPCPALPCPAQVGDENFFLPFSCFYPTWDRRLEKGSWVGGWVGRAINRPPLRNPHFPECHFFTVHPARNPQLRE